ncbi:MAG: vanadium-dependent haloperoxidase [Saprospiraceae bacterium]|nr:vanadium-dependent haloperoxidase [Saprospiraceae bacterium]
MKRLSLLKFFLISAVSAVLFLQSCKDNAPSPDVDLNSAHLYDNKVYLRWNAMFLELDRYAGGYRPGPAPRALAYLGLSAYESVVAGIPENQSMRNLFPGLAIPEADPDLDYYWPACVNASYAYLMPRFFFHMENQYSSLYGEIDITYNQLNSEFAQETTPEILARSLAYGQAVAQAVYDWERADVVGHNAFLDPQPISYTPPSAPGLWQPTPPDYVRAMFPQWGGVRRFALDEDEMLARAPIPYSESPSSLFYNQAMEAYGMVNNIRADGPEAYEQRWMAEFWSDDILGLTFSPPARLLAVADQVVSNENLDLAGCAELYAKLGMALSDAGVALWHSKYHYNVERPITYIRRVVAQNEPDAANWETILNNPVAGFEGVTPAFPGYPSGHAGFGGSGGKILSSMFEYNAEHPGTYSMTDQCHFNRSEFNGTPRAFSSFKELADEDAYSRVPLGVHFRMDCTEGLRIGELAAQRVLELPWKK